MCNLNRISGLDGEGSVILLPICVSRNVYVYSGSFRALCIVLSKLPESKLGNCLQIMFNKCLSIILLSNIVCASSVL